MDKSSIPPLQPLATFYPTGHAPIMPPHPDVYDPTSTSSQPLSAGDQIEFDDGQTASMGGMMPQQDESKPRQRRRSLAPDRTKHKRTRSGCFTCRQRRVKCDEHRPICERCRKGSRDCQYPTTVPSSRENRRSGKSRQQADDKEQDASSDESPRGSSEPLDPIADEEDYDEDEDDLQSPTKSFSGPSSSSRSVPTRTDSIPAFTSNKSGSSRWKSLSRDIRTYLRYYKEHMSFHHYAFKFDRGDFMNTTLVELALDDDSNALLYAIVAFAAYHHAVFHDTMKLSPFLSYYNQSIILLHRSLGSRKPDVTTLLTILQLASIEEFLGDWVNLLGHQRAAYQILTDLFTPETIMQDSTCRQLINWYIRFDLSSGIMSGAETKLGREWFAACQRFYREQAQESPDDLGARFDDYFATCRLMATDVALLNAAKGRNAISDADFVTQTDALKEQFTTFGRSIETAFTDPSHFIKDFPNAPPPSESDITDFRDPNFVYGGELFTMNSVLMDFWALDLAFNHQVNLMTRQSPSPELTETALKMCKMFEAVQYSREDVPGSVLGFHTGIGIASIFLPKDEKHILWCRRKYAFVESIGYIYPPTLRTRMSELWGVDVTQWWLPDDEGYPPTVKAIRAFIDYRARIPEDTMGAHVRNMTGVFRSLDMDEATPTTTTTSNTTISEDLMEMEE